MAVLQWRLELIMKKLIILFLSMLTCAAMGSSYYGSFTGNGAGLTNLSGASASGTAGFTNSGVVVLTNSANLFGGSASFSSLTSATMTVTSSMTASNVIGNGAGITNQVFNFGVTIDGGGTAVTNGYKGCIKLPRGGAITSVNTYADLVGSCGIDLWWTNSAGYPPTVAGTITAGVYPTLSLTNNATLSTLTGWSTNFNAGDYIGFNVVSNTTCTRITIQANYNSH
jgi:hypothetical protein